MALPLVKRPPEGRTYTFSFNRFPEFNTAVPDQIANIIGITFLTKIGRASCRERV